MKGHPLRRVPKSFGATTWFPSSSSVKKRDRGGSPKGQSTLKLSCIWCVSWANLVFRQVEGGALRRHLLKKPRACKPACHAEALAKAGARGSAPLQRKNDSALPRKFPGSCRTENSVRHRWIQIATDVMQTFYSRRGEQFRGSAPAFGRRGYGMAGRTRQCASPEETPCGWGGRG